MRKNVINDEDDEDENLDAEAIKEVTGDVEVHSHSDAHSVNLALVASFQFHRKLIPIAK